MNDKEILDFLQQLAHGYTITLTRDWTYELIINGNTTIKGTSIRECIEKTHTDPQQEKP